MQLFPMNKHTIEGKDIQISVIGHRKDYIIRAESVWLTTAAIAASRITVHGGLKNE